MVLYPCRMNLLQCRECMSCKGKNSGCPFRGSRDESFHYLEDALKNTSVTLKDISETGKADICLSIDNSLPNEAYTLEVSSDRINISSNETAAGFFMVSSLCCSSCRQPFMMVTGNTKERLGFLLSALRMLPVSLIVGL